MHALLHLVPRWLGLALLLALPTLTYAQSPMSPETHNKQLIQQAFARWAAGTGNFFDLLTDDVQWTITGSSPYSKTYTSKQQFIDEAVTPLSVRLAGPIVPKVRNVYADGDVVVAIWDGAATAKDGQPYRNTYSWAMTLKNGRITHVTAFLDLIPYLDVFKRLPGPN
ncbi:nuclear transport factor 2 family protein [uncultured Hymenobacter sp.]|uniref:nuclear transport factor 2 family protein n=1 Tax=uncultured Hymenobacter sp. TaxID=170016 RepID=UPI0035C99EB0